MKISNTSFKLWENIWLGFIFVIGVLLTFLVPPLQKPDEYIHFRRTVALTEGVLNCRVNDARYSMMNKYAQLFSLVDKYGLTQNYQGKFYYKEFFPPLFASGTDNQKQIFNSSEICWLPAISYIPHATGLLLANTFGLNGIYGYYLGRLAPLTIFFCSLIYILRRTKYANRAVFLFCASIPMLIHQVSSFSYDSTQIIIGFWLIFLLLQNMNKKVIVLHELLTYVFFLLLFYLAKPNSYILFFFTPLLFIDQLKLPQKLVKYKLPAIIFGSIIFLLISIFIAKNLIYDSLVNFNFNNPTSPADIHKTAIYKNPTILVEMLVETLEKEFLFYVKGIIGILGWLDYQLGLSIYIIYVFLFGFFIYNFHFDKNIQFPFIKGLILFGIIIGTFFATICGMYLMYTPAYHEIAGTISYGPQGRYFILLLPFVFLLFGLVKKSRALMILLLFPFVAFIIAKTFQAIYLRYYDYQSIYDIIPIEMTSDLHLTPLLQGIEFNFKHEKSGKLRGFSIGPLLISDNYKFPYQKLVIPYQFFFYSGGCNSDLTAINKGIIKLNYIHGNQLNILFNRSIFVDEGENTCLIISPIIEESERIYGIETFVVDKKIQIYPIYNR